MVIIKNSNTKLMVVIILIEKHTVSSILQFPIILHATTTVCLASKDNFKGWTLILNKKEDIEISETY